MVSKITLIAILLFIVVPQQILCGKIHSVDSLIQYNKWRSQNKRIFLNEDEKIYRQSIFLENLSKVNEHKSKEGLTYKVGLNQFSDMNPEEFKHKVLNHHLSKELHNIHKRIDSEEDHHELHHAEGHEIPKSVDWRTKGVVSSVKNQGSCGACWTLSTAGILESFSAIKTGELVEFSNQQILDCVSEKTGYKSYGCTGGYPQQALLYATRNGVVPSSEYAYIGEQAECKTQGKTEGFYPKKFKKVAQNSDALKSALALGPVSIVVDSTEWSYYTSGVFNGCGEKTEFDQLNHAVIAVGYDEEGNWIIKNSWGTGWGENGFMKLEGGPENRCGILYSNYFVTE